MLRALIRLLPSPVKSALKKVVYLRRRRSIAMRYYSKQLELINRGSSAYIINRNSAEE